MWYHEYILIPLWGTTPKVVQEAHRKHDGLAHNTVATDLDTPAVYEEPKPSKIGNVLLSGLPHPRLKGWSYATIAVNVLLTFFTLDLVFREPALYSAKDLRFSRVGFVDSTSAKVLFREQDTNQLPIYAYYRADGSATWTTADKIYYLDDETDFTYPVTFKYLRPATKYGYALSNNLTGEFTTAPAPGTSASTSLTFITSSCIKANFPYNPLNHALDIPGFKHLSNILSALPSPAKFMLFLGDFIYVDVPLRLSSTASHYRAEYRRVYASPSWLLPHLKSLPWLHTLDDHEIANDWNNGNSTPPYPSARDPFDLYHISVNPPIPPLTSPDSNITYFQFSRGPASFFMLDTRTYRTNPTPFSGSLNPIQPSMLGPAQLSTLLTYLKTPEPQHIHWKILTSSVPFTKNWRYGNSDTWGGFLAERATVLTAMHFAERELGVRVVILSGDRHEFGAIRFPHPPPQALTPDLKDFDGSDTSFTPLSSQPSLQPSYKSLDSGPHEFSVGPLSMFYLPFPFRTFRQTDDEDFAIKYVPDGNSKVGVVRLEGVRGGDSNTDAETRPVRSLLRFSLWVDGELSWEYVLTSPAGEFWEKRRMRRGGSGSGTVGGEVAGLVGDALWG